jgi:hypothetical protein
MVWHKPSNIREYVSLAIRKAIYGKDICLGEIPGLTGFSFMPDKFIQSHKVIDKVSIKETMNNVDSSVFRIFNTLRHKVVLFGQDLRGVDYCRDFDLYKQEMEAVYNVVSKYYSFKEIAYKPHPEQITGDIVFGEFMHSYVPAEYLYSDNVEIYLGIYSRCITNARRGTVISLIDLITPKSEAVKEKRKDEILEIRKINILFPKTLGELDEIIKRVSSERKTTLPAR